MYNELQENTSTAKFLKPREVADELRVTREAVYKWLRNGTLKGFSFGGTWRIRREDYEEFITRNSRPTHSLK